MDCSVAMRMKRGNPVTILAGAQDGGYKQASGQQHGSGKRGFVIHLVILPDLPGLSPDYRVRDYNSTGAPSRRPKRGPSLMSLLSTTVIWTTRVWLLTFLAVSAARAQDSSPDSPPSSGRSLSEVGKFLAGAALGLGIHEGAHLFFDVVFDTSPGLRKVTYAGVPFFAITHRSVPPAKEFVISSAGFWAQHGGNEILLTRRNTLPDQRTALAKGMFTFNVAASMAYSFAAFTRTGPLERDTRGMSLASGLSEASIGVVILGPAVLDTTRYFQPGSKWLAWTSRAWKAGAVLLVIKAARQ
jgi:hypothetical protein